MTVTSVAKISGSSPPPPPPSSDKFQQVLDRQIAAGGGTQGHPVTQPPPSAYNAQTQNDISQAQKTDALINNSGDDNLGSIRSLVQKDQRQWNTVKQDITPALTTAFTNTYHQLGDGKLAPDTIVKPNVAASQNKPIDYSSNYAAITGQAMQTASLAGYNNALQSWKQQQITSTDLANLKQNVVKAENSTGATAQQYWAKVNGQIQNIQEGGLFYGNQPKGQLPQDTAKSLEDQLNALFKGDEKFAANNAAVYQSTVSNLQQLNLTDKQIQPVVKATQDYQKYLSDHKIDPNSAAATTGGALPAYTKLQQAIENQLLGTQNNLAGITNRQWAAALMNDTTRAIANMGSQTVGYLTAVLDANYDLRVTKPAQQVAQAYASQSGPQKGAQAAADKLKQLTIAAGDPSYAAAILDASLPTLTKIGTQLGIY